MSSITVIIISKDDHDVISDAIVSAKKLTDQILVIDSNTNEYTSKICQKLKVKHIRHPFKNFSDQRNFGISHATTPWVYYLDSDERLTDQFCHEVTNMIRSFSEANDIGGFAVRRKTFYYGHDWNFYDKVERLFYRKRFVNWVGVVHETPKIDGIFSEIKSPIIHLTHRNLTQMIRKTNDWSNYEAELRFRKNHPPVVPWRFVRVMLTEFFNSFVKNKGYKNGTYGFIEAIYQSFSIFITYAKLWELQKTVKN